MTDTALKPRLEPLRKSETEPTWLQIKNLFEKYGCTPPTALRDEVTILAMWAWYGKSLDAALSAHPHPVETVQADVQPVAWPNERVNIPDPNNKDARIVGFRIREGDEAWGEHGFSEPLFWLSRVTSTDHQAAVAALVAERDKIKIDLRWTQNQRFILIDAREHWKSRAETAEASLAERDAELKTAREYLDGQIHEWMLKYREASAECSRFLSTLTACQREKEGLREVATNLFHSLPDILDEAAFGGNYSKLCDFTDAVHAMETALNSEGA